MSAAWSIMADPSTALSRLSLPLTPTEALSGIFGSISLASWIFVLIPQLYENFRHSDASGISLVFLTVWLLGDIANLIGAVWARLVPTVIALAIYFCAADTILIAQVVYYNYFFRGHRLRDSGGHGAPDVESDEEEPLLSRRESGSSDIGLPGSHKRRRRRSSALSDGAPLSTSTDDRAIGNLGKIAEMEEPATAARRAWVQNTAGILAVCLVGALGWLICYATGLWTPAAPPSAEGLAHSTDKTPLGAEIIGYASAVAYLGARIPQIVKNHRDRSCEGLSLLFFMLSLTGNLTYGAGILFHSIDKAYVLKNLPWLIGSLGTVAEDFMIFTQFKMYGDGDKAAAEQAVE